MACMVSHDVCHEITNWHPSVGIRLYVNVGEPWGSVNNHCKNAEKAKQSMVYTYMYLVFFTFSWLHAYIKVGTGGQSKNQIGPRSSGQVNSPSGCKTCHVNIQWMMRIELDHQVGWANNNQCRYLAVLDLFLPLIHWVYKNIHIVMSVNCKEK
jgi:hypothetical protein